MSLKAFHLLFIALSIVLATFFAAWAMEQYRVGHEMVYVAVAGVSLAAGAVLAVYAAAFQRKTRQL